MLKKKCAFFQNYYKAYIKNKKLYITQNITYAL